MEKCLMRFRIPWRFEGAPAVLVSRAYDSAGNVQPSRDQLVSQFGARRNYHYNGWQSWAVAASGEVSNVFV
jgi:sulfane dehydrogenase subunit SoxC